MMLILLNLKKLFLELVLLLYFIFLEFYLQYKISHDGYILELQTINSNLFYFNFTLF